MSDDSPFESAESYYARFRPGYGETAIDHLVDRFSLGDDARVLDLGCGAGQLAVPLADHAREVVAMDPNEAMLEEARAATAAACRTNIEFVHGSDTDLHDGLAPIRLTTMGRSFHWMDQRATLAALRDITEAASLLVDHAFQNLRLHRIFAWTIDDNDASQAVLRRLGFRHEGTYREHVFTRGEYRDIEHFGLLDSEWEGVEAVLDES